MSVATSIVHVFGCDCTSCTDATRQWDSYSASSTTANQSTAVCVRACVCAAEKEKKLISTGRNVFTSKGWMEGV